MVERGGGETKAEDRETYHAGFVVYVQDRWDEGGKGRGERVCIVVCGFAAQGEGDAEYAWWGDGEAPDLEAEFGGEGGEGGFGIE